MNIDVTTVQTVHNLCRRWELHKERLAASKGAGRVQPVPSGIQLDGPRRTDAGEP